MTSGDIRAQTRTFEGSGLRTFAQQEPIVWQRTEGSRVWDAEGREYLEMNGGFAAASIGFCHPRVTAAIVAQAGVMTHCPSSAPSAVRSEFYEKLIGIAPAELTRIIPTVTGSQATEIAVALARAVTGRRDVIAFSGGYLGRTPGSVTYAEMFAVDLLLRPLKQVPVDERTARRAGLLDAVLRKAGTRIGVADRLIAAAAIEHNAVVVTSDTLDFLRIPGLVTENWRTA